MESVKNDDLEENGIHDEKTDAEKKIRERENKEEFKPQPFAYKFTKQNNLRRPQIYGPPVTPFPNWVYEMYDPQCLVERIHAELSKSPFILIGVSPGLYQTNLR